MNTHSMVTGVFERPAFARARRLCLHLPEVAETVSWGHPNFRVGRKTFCAFEVVGGRPSIAFKVSGTDAAAALQHPRFFATPYGRGVWVDGAIDWKSIHSHIDRSYRLVAGKRLLALVDGRSDSSRRRRVAGKSVL